MTTLSIEDFLAELGPVLQGETPVTLSPDTVFRDLPAWDSVAVLAVLAVVDGGFGVQLSAADLNRCRTVADLYRLAVAKAS